MKRQEYKLLVENWNNFLIEEEKKIVDQQLIVEAVLLNETILSKIRGMKKTKKAIYTLVLLAKLAGMTPEAYAEELKVSPDLNTPGVTSVKAKKLLNAVDQDPNELKLQVKYLDEEGNLTDASHAATSVISGLAVKYLDSGGPEQPKTTGWITITSPKKAKQALKDLTQAGIDRSAENVGKIVVAVSYQMHFVQSKSMTKFKIVESEMKDFLKDYRSGGAGIGDFGKVKSFTDKHPQTKMSGDDIKETDKLVHSVSAILTCEKSLDMCKAFSDGVQKVKTQKTAAGRATGQSSSDSFSSSQYDVKHGHKAGEVFDKISGEARQILYDIESGTQYAKLKGEYTSKIITLMGDLLDGSGKLDDAKVDKLFKDLDVLGDKFANESESVDLDSEIAAGGAASPQGVDTDDLIAKQSKKLADHFMI